MGESRLRLRLRLVLVGTTSSGSAACAERMRSRIAELGLDNQVLLIEDYGHDQIVVALHATDVYVQPSHVEGLGMSVLEAMACGVPVVATDTDGLCEVIEPEKSGLLVPVRDPDGLAQAVLRLRGDRRLRDRLVRAVWRGSTRSVLNAWWR